MSAVFPSVVQLEGTIVGIATPIGRGALAVIRLSGPEAFAIARNHINPWPVRSRTAQLCTVHGDAPLDQALVTLFPAPDSFTGEDIVEISSHGGLIVPGTIVATLIASGARQALPGEFTRRAVLNGKLDVLQAEAIGDLIDAHSRAMQRTALDQLDGGLSRRLLKLREDLIGLEALIAYEIDFPEEDDGPVPRERIDQAVEEMISYLRSLLSTVPTGEIIRDGAVVVIAGAPNVGKSSLFNALLGRSRAIVTEIPGTTRDALEAVIETGNLPLRLVDTAGLRDTIDPIERLGIEVSERYLTTAHVILVCAETRMQLDETAAIIAARSSAPMIRVRTKSDLVSSGNQSSSDIEAIAVSAETGQGLQDLLDAIEGAITTACGRVAAEIPILTNTRHERAIRSALKELEDFERSWREQLLPAPVASVHLRTAVYELEELIGAVDLEDVLDRVFSTFCVGK